MLTPSVGSAQDAAHSHSIQHQTQNATEKGLWLLPRKDWSNTGRCDLPGRFHGAPSDAWWFGRLRRDPDWIRPLTIANKAGYLVKRGTVLELMRSDGKLEWRNGSLGIRAILDIFDFGDSGSALLASVGSTQLILVELATGRKLWTWNVADGGLLGSPLVWKEDQSYRMAVFPQTTVTGIAFEFSQPSAPPREIWRQNYVDRYWANFGPFGVIADLNNDQRQDILLAGKPSYVAAIDGDTGKILFDLHYPIPGERDIGRPYGLIQAIDLDSDGFRDAVIAACQVEEYVAVVKNEAGRAFRLVWSHFVEHDLPKDDFELRPQTTSASDVDGDGQIELVLGLYNLTGDRRWHTVVIDAMRGWEHRKIDLADRYFWGNYDLNADNVPEIVTSIENSRRYADWTTMMAVDGKTGGPIAELPDARLTTAAPPLPPSIGFYALRSTPWLVVQKDGSSGLIVQTRQTSGEQLWHVRNSTSVVRPFSLSMLTRLAAFSTSDNRITAIDQDRLEIREESGLSASQSLVVLAENRRELVVARSNGTISGGVPNWLRPNVLDNAWSVRGVCPAAWVGPSGERLIAAIDPAIDRYYLYQPAPGQEDAKPRVAIDLPFSPARESGMLLPFGNSKLLLHVTMKTGVHTLASALHDAHGRVLWRDDTEGAYPRSIAVMGSSDDSLRLVMDNHGKIIVWDLSGHKRLVAHGWNETVPGRGSGAKYALPITGPFGTNGQQVTILSPGLEQLEVLDEQGARLAMAPYGSIYEREWCASAVARIRPVAWDLGMLTQQGVFHCADVATAETRWKMDLGCLAIFPARVTSGDLDGDGRDNFLVGLSNGELVALDEQNGQGRILWKTFLDAPILETRIADLDGDHLADILVETDDGRVQVFRSGLQAPRSSPKEQP